MNKRRFFEFFAGGGMARAGLGDDWQCAFANDFSAAKAAAYLDNWGTEHFVLEDVNLLQAADLPGKADLVWGSFPCQDLSLAGAAAGLGTEDRQTRSGAFWAFWRLMRGLAAEGRAPSIIVLENVYGALTTNGGGEFATLCTTLTQGGYQVGAMVVDARHFVPQSRPRLFIFAFKSDLAIPANLVAHCPNEQWHPLAMQAVISRLDKTVLERWLWLDLPIPSNGAVRLAEIIEAEPQGVSWHTPEETKLMLSRMSPANRRKLDRMRASGDVRYGTIYRRTRPRPDGRSAVMAELRDDGIAGCLRTPGGGSSRQFVLEVNGATVRSRLMSPREAARLMGLDDSYRLPSRYNEAYHLLGDGVVVDVVRFLDRQLLQPVLACAEAGILEAAE